jgi:WD40 repeat protein
VHVYSLIDNPISAGMYLLSSNLKLEGVLQGHSKSVTAIDVDYASQLLFTGSEDQTVIAWKLHDHYEKIVPVYKIQVESTVECVKTWNDIYLIVGCKDRKIRVYDYNVLKLEKEVQFELFFGYLW